jgi:hypothetical protein
VVGVTPDLVRMEQIERSHVQRRGNDNAPLPLHELLREGHTPVPVVEAPVDVGGPDLHQAFGTE